MAGAASPALARAPLTSERPPAGRGGAPVPGAEALVKEARISGNVGYAVADARSGAVLESRAAEIGTAPASVTKAITALYALETLGAAYRFTTRVIATGRIHDGIVEGNLVLVGGGDPVLDTRDMAALAGRLKEAGIREVRGEFEVYDGDLPYVRAIDPGQPDHVGYNPAVSGIALNFNRVHFQWQRTGAKYDVMMDARSGSFRPDVTMATMEVVDRSSPVYTYEEMRHRDVWTVARGALGREGARWLPVRKPGLYAGEVFATLARSNGIVLRTPKLRTEMPEGQEVAQFQSVELTEVLHGMLKYSNNLTAEMVGLAATLARVGQVDDLAASAAQMNEWAQVRLGMKAPGFVDHSGLGDASRISPADMVRGLSAAGRAALLRPLLKPVKLLDTKGRTINDHPVKAAAKTGTLNFVSGLAGYVTALDGRELVFAIFAADEETRASIPREMRERPPGARTWASRARRLQRQLIMRWGAVLKQAGAVETEG